MRGLTDPEVYEVAKKLGRLVVTHNDQDFRPYADKSLHSGVIGVSQNLKPPQMDTKLVALLRKTSYKNLYGAFHYISGETRV